MTSFLASRPADWAKWRTRLGSTIRTSIAFSRIALAHSRSYPPLASITTLVALCLRSQEINCRRPSAVLSNVRRCDNARMHASTLPLATSIPATTRPFCAIIQLPSLLGSGSKPMQLFGLRKTPDLSHAPRQALAAFEHERAQIQRRAVWCEPPVRAFWQILQTQERDISRNTI